MPERLSYAELSCRNGRKREKEKYENRKYSNEKVGKNSDGSTVLYRYDHFGHNNVLKS